MEGYCRACLNKFNEPTDLLQYCESNRRLFVYCTGIQVKHNDTFTFQLCKECYLNLKFSCKFKKQCRISDKKFKSYLTLKKDRESLEFCTYLKNIADTLTLRLPITSSSSTPVHQKNYDDDDNESTCTSMQNFMSDILQGEEMLPTEARIIREVIQEEADILDDSLDSHWLQEDVSIDNAFGMDFNFAGFSTPHSINNDHCYTPRRLISDNENDTYYFSPEDTIQRSVKTELAYDQKDMPVLEIGETNVTNIDYDIKNMIKPYKQELNTSNENDMPLLDDCDIELDGIAEDNITMDNLECGYHIATPKKPNNKQITVILNKGVAPKAPNSPLTNELEYYLNKVESNRMTSIKTNDKSTMQSDKNNIYAVLNQDKVDVIKQLILTPDFKPYIENQNIDSEVNCELDQYINKAELRKQLNNASNQSKNSKKMMEKCSIVRNLEIALQNDESVEFSLDQLLISPQVSVRSGASTPTINNILFGNRTPRITDTIEPDLGNTVVKKEPNDTDIIEDFLKEDWQCQSTPKKGYKETKRRKFVRVKDLSKLKESKVKENLNSREMVTKRKNEKRNNLNTTQRGHKDIKRLKHLLGFENENHSDSQSVSEMSVSDCEQSITEPIDENTIDFEREHHSKTPISNVLVSGQSNLVTESVDNQESTEFEEENLCETLDCKMLDIEQSRKLTETIDENAVDFGDDYYTKILSSEVLVSGQSHLTTESIDNKKHTELNEENFSEMVDSEMLDAEQSHKITEPIDNDLDISISNLLNFDDNQSVDLNMSIASDFLKEDNNDNDSGDLKDPENSFKIPFSPPDNKYDLDKCLCKICDKSFKTQGALKLHFIKIHKQQLPKAKKNVNKKVCPKCGKGFSDPSNFNRHIKSHDGPDNFKCEYCTLDFPTRGRFNHHMRCHASEIASKEKKDHEPNKDDNKSNPCKEEENTFKKFVCSMCGKAFKKVGALNVHIRRHTKNYTWRCEICQKGFVRKYDLDVHRGTHTKDHPFACQYCPNKYSTRHQLMGHIYRHLGKEKFKCQVCDIRFVSNQHLKQHYRSEKCVKKRKALEEGREVADVTVTYSIPSNQSKDLPTEGQEDQETKHDIEIKTELCLELAEEIEIEPFSSILETNENSL